MSGVRWPESEEGYLLADAHVHFYECFDEDTFFSAAAANLAISAPRQRRVLRYLLMTESQGCQQFRAWERRTGSGRPGRWSFSRSDESTSLIVTGSQDSILVVVAGRQVRTSSGLEILALGTDHQFETGLPFPDALVEARAHAQIVCIPWGFGKWWFERGRTVLHAIEGTEPDLALGDNAGRLTLMPSHQAFRAARRRGIPILPGSDPLPLRWHARRVGRLGFSVAGQIDMRRPFGRLLEAIRSGHTIQHRGDHTNIFWFVVDQSALRVHRMVGKMRRGAV